MEVAILEDIIQTLTHNWILAAIAAILVFFVIGALIRMAIKTALTALIIGVILFAVIGLSPQELIDKGESALNGSNGFYKHTIQPLIEKEIDQADYSKKPNGDYTLSAKDLKITGKQDDNKVIIQFKGKTYTINTDDLGKQVQNKLNNFNQ